MSTPRSAPTSWRAGAESDTPRCPKCGTRGAAVAKFKFWLAHGTWVYVCSHEPVSRGGEGRSFCGFVFEDPGGGSAVCKTCHSVRTIEVRQGQCGYWCAQGTCRGVFDTS